MSTSGRRSALWRVWSSADLSAVLSVWPSARLGAVLSEISSRMLLLGVVTPRPGQALLLRRLWRTGWRIRRRRVVLRRAVAGSGTRARRTVTSGCTGPRTEG